MSAQTCRTCGTPVYFVAAVDHVGRRTSRGAWAHYGPEPEHTAVPA